MNNTTIGILTGAAVAAAGTTLLYVGVSDANAEARAQNPASPGTRVKEVAGSALLITGLGLALGSGIKALNGERAGTRKLLEAGEARESRVQTLIFSRKHYTVTAARNWAEAHGYKNSKIDLKTNTIRLRQMKPQGRMRTIEFGRGIKAVVSYKE